LQFALFDAMQVAQPNAPKLPHAEEALLAPERDLEGLFAFAATHGVGGYRIQPSPLQLHRPSQPCLTSER
jgi:hypothetical protein